VTPLWSAEVGDSLDIIYVTGSPELHPEYGKKVIEKYFQPFEDSMDEEGLKGMNYFFTDELMYYPTILSWCEGMEEIFRERKGYDILPWLPALFASKDGDVDEEAAKVRMDYSEVVTELVEERYFKPIFDWHYSRGLIYGCDNMGRGLRPLQYMIISGLSAGSPLRGTMLLPGAAASARQRCPAASRICTTAPGHGSRPSTAWGGMLTEECLPDSWTITSSREGLSCACTDCTIRHMADGGNGHRPASISACPTGRI
jgi:hypothetical protein